MAQPSGRRERKKAAIRLALSNAAMRLFLARGFDDVTLREVADAADVSTTTLMNHFPTKEALVFDRNDETERALVAALTGRRAKISVLAALRGYLRARMARVVVARRKAFMRLVRSTPALAAAWETMWMRHERVLARALARDLGRHADDRWCTAMAHLVLAAAALSEGDSRPVEMIETAFDILERGSRSATSPR